ncbi:hypothetical protein LCGC14_2977060 [marine sediment metagenome]|uniref:Uncharacterized protein n=1 Tax=marine sediment metagenome TaxID=412755 RepID=A0A0F8X7P0_9ZZZZ
MLDFIADRADIIIAAVQTALTLDMLPVVWHQFRAKASTVPLLSSVPTAIGLAVLGLVFFSTGLYLATVTVVVGAAVWTIVAGQRIGYNRHDGSTSSTPDADPELRVDDSRLHGSSSVNAQDEGGECNCVSCIRASWFRHHNRPAGGGQGQGVGVGLDGDSQGTSSPVEEVPDLVHNSSATTHYGYSDRTELEEA